MYFTETKHIHHRYILYILLLIQCLILYDNFLSLPLTHDELSAIYRCRFSNFKDLIESGIQTDGHPAGVQIFLWTYLKFTGLNVFLIKLPFLLAANGSLILLFAISRKMFDEYTATVCSLIFITSEYFISQQGLARPYSPGLFFNLGLFYCLLRSIDKSGKTSIYYSIAVVFAVLSYYTHYFSFLQSLMIWLMMPLFFKTLYQKTYVISFIASFLLFLPHITISLNQISMGGLGWLNKPDLYFFKEFFLNLFNNNLYYLSAMSIVAAISLINLKSNFRNYGTALSLWLLPIAVIGLYSIYRAPVLQGPALYFSTPFLLIALSSGLGTGLRKIRVPKLSIHAGIRAVSILIVLSLGIYSLCITRNYFKRRYFQPVKAFIEASEDYVRQHPGENTLIIWQGNPNYFNIYRKILNSGLPVVFTDTLISPDFQNKNTVICNQLHPKLMHQIASQYPCLKEKQYNFLFEHLIFTNKNCRSTYLKTTESFTLYSAKDAIWSNSRTITLADQPDIFEEFVYIADSIKTENELVYEVYSDTLRLYSGSVPLHSDAVISVKMKDIFGGTLKNKMKRVKFFLKNNPGSEAYAIRIIHKQRPDNPFEYTGIFR